MKARELAATLTKLAKGYDRDSEDPLNNDGFKQWCKGRASGFRTAAEWIIEELENSKEDD